MEQVAQETTLNFDKSSWQKVKLGDVVKECRESCKDPAAEGIEHIIGLEHITPEDVHLRHYDTPKSERTFTRKFKKGDVLFGRRRAYLKKAAQAPFNGICSGDIIVMRAKEGLRADLLPFLINNDKFFDFAVKHSAGGLSPRAKFKHLANYEFLLPPKDQQAQIAELLWAMDEVVEGEESLLNKQINLKHSFRKEVFLGFDKNILTQKAFKKVDTEWKVYKISQVCEIHNTLRKPINKATRAKMKGDYPYYGPTSILDHISEYRVEGEYVLIGEDGDHFLKFSDWSMSQYVKGKFNVNNHAHILKGTELCMTKWIYYSLQHRNIVPHIARQGATRYKLNKEGLKEILILLPPVSEQENLIKKLDFIEASLSRTQHKIRASKELLRSLINQIF
jgi:type I restriction enzyme S subunit